MRRSDCAVRGNGPSRQWSSDQALEQTGEGASYRRPEGSGPRDAMRVSTIPYAPHMRNGSRTWLIS
jgi:hypothetical protein